MALEFWERGRDGSMAGLIRTIGMCKTYGAGENAVHALLPCDLKIMEGETVAVVGASGSGKSTLLHLLGGLDTPTSGKILFRGKELSALDDSALSEFRRRHVGFVFQNYNLVPELTAGENIELPLLLDGKRPDRDYLDPAMVSTRCAVDATSRSCVTRTSAIPLSAETSCSSRTTSRPVAESRLPVGSSHSSSSGRALSARAMATRCCWPPESSPG